VTKSWYRPPFCFNNHGSAVRPPFIDDKGAARARVDNIGGPALFVQLFPLTFLDFYPILLKLPSEYGSGRA